MIRPQAAQHYIKINLAAGHAVDDLLAGTQIDIDKLESPNYLISRQDYEILLSNIIKINEDNGIGLYIFTHNRLADYGVLAYAGMTSKSIREGIDNVWGKFGTTLGVMAKPSINERIAMPNHVCIEFAVPWIREDLYRFSIEEGLCLLRYFGKELVGNEPIVARLDLSFPRLPYHAKLEAMFNCPVNYNAVCTRIFVSQSWVDSPLTTSDKEVHGLCTAQLKYILHSMESEGVTISRVRDSITSSISQSPSLELTASELGLSPRSLSRHLAKLGTSYRELLEQTRLEIACNMLQTSRVNVKEIALRLAYKDTASFRRAFKSWTGITTHEFRLLDRK